MGLQVVSRTRDRLVAVATTWRPSSAFHCEDRRVRFLRQVTALGSTTPPSPMDHHYRAVVW